MAPAFARWLAPGLILLALQPAAAATLSRLFPGFNGYAKVVAAAPDGSLFVAGNGTAHRDWLMKLDAALEPVWTVSVETIDALSPAPDGGVLSAGYSTYEGPDGYNRRGHPLRAGVGSNRHAAVGDPSG